MRKKITIILILFFVFMAVAAYGIGVIYFSSHFLPGSMVNGFNCSYLTAEEAQALLAEKIDAYVLAIEEKNNGVESLSAREAGASYIPDGTARAILLDQDRFLWFLAFSQHKIYSQASCIALDEDQLRAALKELRCMRPENVTKPEDAKLTETPKGYEITPETEGDLLDEEKVLELVKNAVLNSILSVNLEEEGCYVLPQVYRDDPVLVRNCEKANLYTGVIITYDFADSTETVDREIIKNWLTLDENGEMTLDHALVSDYVSELARKYDSFSDFREFRTYDGSYITVRGGDFGWIIDVPAETDSLIAAIEHGETDVREPVYANKGGSRASDNDIGYTYLEIDLTNQRMVFYKDGEPIVDTAVVTGDPNGSGTATPVGCYTVSAKESPATLPEDQGGVQVSFWLPFCETIGICDAGWRSEFGGRLYLTQGSYGCVQTPYSAMESIYRQVEEGIPVVIYEREESLFQ